jgi:flagellar M-ring protein FliF
MQSGAIADEARVAGIQRLVAAAVPDLELTDVVVLDELGRVISYSSPAEPSEPPIVEEQSAVQQYFRARARAAIQDSAPGLKFDVRVIVLPRADVAVTSVLDEPASSARSAAAPHKDFSMRILVVTSQSLAPDEQLAIRNAIATSVGLEPANGDSVEFEVGPITPVIPRSALPMARSPARGPDLVTTHHERGDLGWPVWASGLAIIAVIILIAVLGLGRNSGLLQEDREAFVLRIRRQLGLSGDEGNV